ncbi:fibronectin type III domain-containing protein [Paenibacillus rigui]|uniref:Uncharacterized protein n=1 Tax=Paenibacillus rigui TaxID=554312 RepID=A0A229UMC0_9BACL|nr:fibronectin type III domain-containing protein [Paenibacillus rigui]OXM84464.1 hypothetical protein CF651_20540 [Paenibacillus rigui]
MKRKRRFSVLLAMLLACSGLVEVPSVPLPVAAAASTLEAPVNVRVPALAYDESSITLVWEKPIQYSSIIDYKVYMNGQFIGNANTNTTELSPAKKYIDKFYSTEDTQNKYVKVTMHNFTATNLQPDTTYSFTVRSVDAAGNESADSETVIQATTSVQQVFNIVDYGAVSGGTVVNTTAIQNAIDAASPGSKVLVPAGVFKTGAIWLKSDMTLEVAEGATLLGSENANDYAYNYMLYNYTNVPRFYSLINAHTYDYGSIRNIRIVGKGTIDGNGWKPPTGTNDGDFPIQFGSSSSNVGTYGVLAKAQKLKAMELGLTDEADAYSTRSNLITLRGVDNVYYGGFTALNPSNHTLVNLNSNHVTVNGVKLLTYDDNNADGIEFAHGDGITVFNTVFDTGDDCMNFAAGQGAQGQKEESTRNAWIFNNYFREGHGAVVTGSHTAAWIENILAEDNVMFHTDIGLRAKTNTPTGGGARNIVFRDSAMKDITNQAFIFSSAYSDANAVIEYEPAPAPSQFKHITIKNISVDTVGKEIINVAGVDGGFHEDIHFEDVTFYNIANNTKTPANMNYLRNSSFKNVKINGLAVPWKTITNSTGLIFSDTTMDSVSNDASVAPAWPGGSQLHATVTDSTYVTLGWTAATDNVKVGSYKIMNGSTTVATVAGTTLSYKVTGLSPAQVYNFKVEAADATGNWTTTGPSLTTATTGTVDTVAPAAPAGLNLIKITDGTVPNTTWLNITWTAATDTYGIHHYNIYQNGSEVGAVAGTVTKYNATGLDFATDYTYEVEAVDGAGNRTKYPGSLTVKTAAAYDTGVPKWPARSALTASQMTTTAVQLSWPAATDDLHVAGYRLYQNDKPLEGAVKFTPVNAAHTVTGTTYSISGLSPGTTYTFKVEAGDDVNKWTGTGPSLTITTASLDTAAPTWSAGSALTVSEPTASSVKLSWDAAADNVAVNGYKVYKGAELMADLPSTALSYTVTGLSSATTYTFKVEAGDASGNWSVDGPSAQATTLYKKKDSKGSSNSTSVVPTPMPIPSSPPSPTPAPGTGPIQTPGTTPAEEGMTPVPGRAKFEDVKGNFSWAQQAIETLAAHGVIQGVTEKTFEPHKNITRAEFITLLVRVLHLQSDFSANYSDVQSTDYYYEALGITRQLGITDGVGDNMFHPGEEISRQDMMVMCARALQATHKLEGKGNSSDLSKYSDYGHIAPYAAESVAALVHEGLVEGDGQQLKPKAYTTRAETAAIIYRIYSKH